MSARRVPEARKKLAGGEAQRNHRTHRPIQPGAPAGRESCATTPTPPGSTTPLLSLNRPAAARPAAVAAGHGSPAPPGPAPSTNREEPFPGRRGATVLECGDWSPLLRRRLVAVELPCGCGHAGALALARAMNAPSHPHMCRSLTATSRLKKAVTSHRTPQSCSFVCGSRSSATVDRSRRLALTVAPRPFTGCCCDPDKERRGLAHSTTLARRTGRQLVAPAFWSAPVLWRFPMAVSIGSA